MISNQAFIQRIISGKVIRFPYMSSVTRKIFPAKIINPHTDNPKITAARSASHVSMTPVPNRNGIMNGVNGGKKDINFVANDPGFVMK